MTMAVENYDRDFPNLNKLGWQKTSDPDCYNCIAYAAGDMRRRWWPGEYPPKSGDYWPPGVPWEEETVEVFSQAFATLGYVSCGKDSSWETGYEKVAIYVLNGKVEHMAKQQTDGTWRSKLGKTDEDIEHTLEGVEGPVYGKAVAYLKRPLPGTATQ